MKKYFKIAAVLTAIIVAATAFVGCTPKKREKSHMPSMNIEKIIVEATIIDVGTIQDNEGVEYSIDGKKWQMEKKFTGLTPNTNYTLYARYAEDNEYYAGPQVKFEVKTLKHEQDIPSAIYHQANKTITFEENSALEYSFEDGTYTSERSHTYIENGEKVIKVRYKETNDKYKSDEQEIKVMISNFYAGFGTESDPYQIATAQHFRDIEDNWDEDYYKQIEDIDFTSSPAIIPKMIHYYDGNGYKLIKPLVSVTATTDTQLIGLFKQAIVVKNITVENAEVSYTDANNGTAYIGIIAGIGQVVENCKVSGSITMENGNNRSMIYIGGIVGGMSEADGNYKYKVVNSFADVKVRCNSEIGKGLVALEVGGLFGGIKDGERTPLIISESVAKLDCELLNTRAINVGGLAGSLVGDVDNCYATGSITTFGSENTIKAGGLIGNLINGGIENCYAAMNISINATNQNAFVGGMAGMSATTSAKIFKDCFFSGNISVTTGGSFSAMRDSLAAGAFVNYTATNCYHSNNLTAPITLSKTTAIDDEIMKTITWQRDTLLFNADIWNFVEGEYPTLK